MNLQKKTRSGQLALRGGSYSLMMTGLVLAILIAVNLFAAALPATLTRLDISSSKLYSITSNTKVVVNSLQKDVTIYWVVQADQEDTILENLLSKYESLSAHLTVVKKNPDVYPTFTEQYTGETVPNNSLIVECGDRYRYVSYNDLYETEFDYYSYTYTTSGFDGEGAITSAIDYVVTEELPLLYVLEGHGEASLSESFSQAVEKDNIQTAQLSLLTVEQVPEDADAVLIHAPATDISETEAVLLSDYVQSGGKLLVLSGPAEEEPLSNLNSLLEEYSVTVNEGIVIEGDRSRYMSGYPYVLVPELQSAAVTDPLLEAGYSAVLPLAQGLTVGYTGKAEVTSLMDTTESAFSKVAGYGLSTYTYEEGDIDGPFSLGVSVEAEGGGQMIWLAVSEMFLEDMYNALSSGANVDMTMNALSTLMGEREAISIRSKSLNYNYLTIDASTGSTLKALMIGVFPLAYLTVGIGVIVRKRGKQNETV